MMEEHMDDRLFSEYRLLILKELERLNTSFEGLSAKLESFRTKELNEMHLRLSVQEAAIVELKVKAAIVGSIGGLVCGSLTSAFITYFVTGSQFFSR